MANSTHRELFPLLKLLIAGDTDEQKQIMANASVVSKELETVNANIGKAEEYAKNVKALEQKQLELPKKSGAFDDSKKKLEEEKEKQPERDKLDESIATLKSELPQYDTANALEKDIKSLNTSITAALSKQRETQAYIVKKEAEIKASREKYNTLLDAEAKKEKLDNEKEKLTEQKSKLEELREALNDFNVLCAELTSKQSEYATLSTVVQNALDKYNTQNKAFLDEQAGILASALEDGTPCPVCGSTHHPSLATMSENAPTEAELKKSKKEYENAQKKAEEKSVECGTLKGQADTFEKNIKKEIFELLDSCELENALDSIKEKLTEICDKLLNLTKQITVEAERIKERKSLRKHFP